MAKRFTDTEKWRDEWWGSLPNDYRMIWLWLVDSCSIGGFWKKDFRGLNFNCNTNISESEFLEVFGSRLIDCGKCFFIPKFLLFQYPKGLISNKPAILAVNKELQSSNHYSIIIKSLPNDYLIIKDKDKDKDKDIDKDKDTVKVKEQVKEKPKPKIEIIYPFNSPEFLQMWSHWKDYKKNEHRFNYKTTQSEQASLNELAGLATDEPTAIKIIHQSMAKGWKGFFELKTNINGKQATGGNVSNLDIARKIAEHYSKT